MSKFHGDISEVLEDVYTFLQATLQNEILSATALTHKESLLIKIGALNASYPQLQLSLKDDSRSLVKQDGVAHSEVTSQPSSPPPYVDMNGTNSCNRVHFEYVSSDAAQDESYDTCLSDRSASENTSSTKAEDEGEKDYPLVPAAELHACEKNGYLEKKGRERLGFLNPFQRRWCAIKDGVMYYYERSTDRRQKGMIPLAGYQARPFSVPSKDSKKSNFCFELVCPGKRTYQFIAVSAKDMKQWIAAVERNSSPASSGMKTYLTPFYESGQNLKHLDSCDSEDIYELVEEEKDSKNNTECDEQQLYDEGQSVVEGEQVGSESANESSESFNYQEWYVGLWDCKADEPNELSFLRGDIIHIVSKEYDANAWWVGDKRGQIGFVPKSYLMEAYEPC